MASLPTLALAFSAFIGLVNSACNYGTSSFAREPSVPVSTFGYTGLQGPLNWYGLNATNALCAKGDTQSPINLASASTIVDHVTLEIPSYPKGAVFENLGTNVEVVVNGSLVDNGKTYNLAQFHFHTPGEHRIDFEFYPMETHFVFEAADKSIAVVAFLVELGQANSLFTSVFSSISAIATPGDATLTGPLSFDDLENHLANNNVFRYNGSLTTPPCSQGVDWIISAKPLYIDADTYIRVKDVVKFNSRYTQNTLGQINLLQNAANELNAA